MYSQPAGRLAEQYLDTLGWAAPQLSKYVRANDFPVRGPKAAVLWA